MVHGLQRNQSTLFFFSTYLFLDHENYTLQRVIHSIPYFYTKSLSTSTALRQWGINMCMICQFHVSFCSHSNVFTVQITSLRVSHFVPQMAFFRAPNQLKSKHTGWGCKVDGVTMSHQILWWCPESVTILWSWTCLKSFASSVRVLM